MKSRYVAIVLGLLTILTFLFILDNIFSIWEQASYARFKPVTTGLPSAQISRDVQVADETADFFFVPVVASQPKRPLLVVLHGGFLQGGNKKNYAYLGGLGVRSGYVVALVQTQSYPGIFTKPFYSKASLTARALPGQAKRLAAFMHEVGKLAETFGFDATRVHVLAHGSGALLLGDSNVNDFKSITLISPIYSLTKHVNQFAPMQLRALTGYITDADAMRLSPDHWLQDTVEPVLLICTERDLPGIKDACKDAIMTRKTGKPIQKLIVQRPSHFELMLHLGSKIEQATEPLKEFLFDNVKL